MSATSTPTIWIDLDNTPHVPFFLPIIRRLRERGNTVVLTARDAFQVCELADQAFLVYTKVGRHYGKKSLLKVLGLVLRSIQLLPFVLKERPSLALSHGSRAQILLCNLLRIPTVMIMDYEHARTPPLVRPRWEIVPEALLNEVLHCKSQRRIRSYKGIKEDVYAANFEPRPELLEDLKLDPCNVIVTIRPPASEAHYHNPESDAFFEKFLNRVCRSKGIQAVLLPRNKAQESDLRKKLPHWPEAKVVIPQEAVNGLNLLWHSDLVVSGGGTVNREAAALGVPAYSIFKGKVGAVDRQLHREGRMVLIENMEEIETRIALNHRVKSRMPEGNQQALEEIINHVEEIVRSEYQ